MLNASRRAGLLLALPVAASTVSCTASLELDRFKKAQSVEPLDTTTTRTYFDFLYKATGMTSHLDEKLEVYLVDSSNVVRTKAVYTDITGPDFSLFLGQAIPKASAAGYRIDWWADHNRSGNYDGIKGSIDQKDHAWRRELKDDDAREDLSFADGRYVLDFAHDTFFQDILLDPQNNPISPVDEALPLKLRLVGVGPYVDKVIELRVVDRVTKRLVALHRQGKAKESYVAIATNILDEATAYDISIYADVDGDGRYSATDPSWVLELMSATNGIDQEVNLGSLPQAPIVTGEP